MLYLARRCDPDVEQLRKTLGLDPDYFFGTRSFGCVVCSEGPNVPVDSRARKGHIAGGVQPILGELGRTYALSGKRHDARKITDRLIGEWERGHIGAYDVASSNCDSGDKDEALARLGRAYEDRTLLNLNNEPELDPLRADPRFKDMLRRMNFRNSTFRVRLPSSLQNHGIDRLTARRNSTVIKTFYVRNGSNRIQTRHNAFLVSR